MKKYLFPLALFSIILLLTSCKESKKKEMTNEPELPYPAHLVINNMKVPEWVKNANIYEVNIRQYSPEGTLAAFENHLPRLKDLGVDILWFMPVYPISETKRKGSLGSYYAVSDFTAIHPDYGTMDEFKALVKRIHEMGMFVLMDWVPNHTGWDHKWVNENRDFYTIVDDTIQHPQNTDWYDVADLNHDNSTMRKAMIEDMKFWVEEVNVDGFRCDMAGKVPDVFWKEARPELEKYKPLFMLAEWENHPPHFETAFQMDYNWVLLHLLEDIAQGKKSLYDLNEFLQADFAKFPLQNIHMNFTTNHDENAHNGSMNERYGDAAHAMNALVFTLNGMPLIYSGQEVGLNKRLNFYDKDEIDWSGNEKEQKFYKILLQLKHNNKALWNGEFGGRFTKLNSADDVLAFFRKKDEDAVAVIINLSDKNVVSPFYPQLRNYFNIIGERYDIDKNTYKMELGPWGYVVMANKI